MKVRFYLLFVFFTFLFLFYPGDSEYIKIFTYNRRLFAQTDQSIELKTNPIPYLRYSYPPQVTAEGVLIIDLPSFTPIYAKTARQRLIPGCMTKVITALVASDIYKPDDILTVKRVITEGQLMELAIGEKITIENLLYGILVHSGNDAAYVLADNYGQEKFVNLMNAKARELKMSNSHFVDPAGLDEFNQYSSPYDLALAARELLAHPLLKKMVATKEITIADVDFKYFHKLSNVNKLLGEVQGIGGLKTGYTENAKENLISFYKKDDHQSIIIILKSDDRFEDTQQVLSWIAANVDYVSFK